jgi:hypothetical protein
MTATLRACPACSRHVRVTEPACPFCGGELDAAFRSAASPRVPAVGRLSRAALFALGAGGLAAGSACGTASNQSLYGGSSCPDIVGDVNECAVVVSEAGTEAGADGAPDSSASDATVDGAGGVQAPPSDAGADAITEARDANGCSQFALYGLCP